MKYQNYLFMLQSELLTIAFARPIPDIFGKLEGCNSNNALNVSDSKFLA